MLMKPCLSPKEILDVYGMKTEPGVISIRPHTFLEMCPALVYQLDQRSCYKTEAPPPKTERHWSELHNYPVVMIIT